MKKDAEKIIVVKFPEMAKHYIELGLCPPDTPQRPYAGEEDVSGKDVFGVIPIYLASFANSVTEVPVIAGNRFHQVMNDINLIRQYAKPPKRYIVRQTPLSVRQVPVDIPDHIENYYNR